MEATFYGVVHRGRIELYGDPQIDDGVRARVTVYDPGELPVPVFPPEVLEW
jgi:hypothetical protein